VRDPQTLARIKALVIPPAWGVVWIAPALRDLGRNYEFGDLATGGAAERAVIRMLTRHG
jgi:DNA topoisomerase IB